ncbi:uncharacterized protein LOC118489214 [Helianthus annuus]|uniref:uncharacterized protein LOC118489214 n=1 Tax=Helianthus annuus TaxID=4232 RepID=UPI0016533EA2|nr:uncharacterized protein LOC118489214 [Helianthus annuus]
MNVFADVPVKVSVAGPWKSIYSIRQPLLEANIDLGAAFSDVVGNGSNICFWLDCWFESVPFFIRFPDLFKEEVVKECLVEDRLQLNSAGPHFNWVWIRPDLGPVAAVQLQQLQLLTGCWVGSGKKDCWKWNYDNNGIFTVAGIKGILSSANRTVPNNVFLWSNWVPKKVGLVAWRAEMERLPTRRALANRNIPVPNQMYVLCSDYVESCEHVFVSCHYAQMLWQNLAMWCGLPPIIAFGINDLLTLQDSASGSRRKRKVVHAIILVTFWSIWKMRNETVFKQGVPNVTRTLDEIKSMAYLWVKSRSKVVDLTWKNWSRFNLDALH